MRNAIFFIFLLSFFGGLACCEERPVDGILDFHKRGIIDLDADGNFLLSSSIDQGVVLWDLSERRRIVNFPLGDDYAMSVRFGPLGRSFAAGGKSGNVYLWDLDKKGPSLGGIFKIHKAHANRLAWSADGNLVAAASLDNTIKVFNPKNSKQPHVNLIGHQGSIAGVEFDGNRRLISSSEDRTIRVWDARTGDLERVIETEHAGGIMSMVVTKKGLIVVGGFDGEISVWDSQTGKAMGIISAYSRKPVLSLDYDLDSDQLISSSFDDKIFIWRLKDGKRIQDFCGKLHGPVRFYRGSQDYFLSTNESGAIVLSRVSLN